MTNYRIIHRVEIAGKTRELGEVLEESVFAPAPETKIFRAREKPEDMERAAYEQLVTEESDQVGEWVPAPTEIESLLSTGHIEVAE